MIKFTINGKTVRLNNLQRTGAGTANSRMRSAKASKGMRHLSVLFGKRFDNHGSIESSGFFNLPADLGTLDTYCTPGLPQNAPTARADAGIPLELGQVRRLMSVLFGPQRNSEAATVFRGACKFYLQALQAAEHDVEIAYLHLITGGEILSSGVDVEHNCMLDAATRSVLAQMEAEMKDGARAARIVRSKLRSVKRRFVAAVEQLIDSEFFERGEARHTLSRLKQLSFPKVLSAAYDLRSRYVHTGRSFDVWIRPRGPDNEEVQMGKPIVEEQDYGRILTNAPTYIGLERIIRYSLLRFAERRLAVDLVPTSSDGQSGE